VNAVPDEILTALRARELPEDEVGLREALEAQVPGWDLLRLTSAAAKRWKCHYRLMAGQGYYDGNTAAEAYARALLAALQKSEQ
jgi:hypothetical protein